MVLEIKKIIPALLLLPVLLLPLTACDSGSGSGNTQKKAAAPPPVPAATPATGKIVLAAIDGQPVTAADLKEYLALFSASERQLPEKLEARTKVLEHLIDRKLLLTAARKAGYDKLDELKKHGSLNSTEKETIILRAFLTDRISRPATPDQETVATFQKQHPDLNTRQAREKAAAARQRQIFAQLMAKLRKEHKIVIHHDNLVRLPAS